MRHVVTAQGAFESWANSRQSSSSGRRRLSQRSVAGMRWHWKSWCDFLDTLPLPWQQAQPSDVHAFLSTLQGSRVVGRIRTAGGQARALHRAASGVTRFRYARLLQDVYSHCVSQGWVGRNPVEARAVSADRGDSLVLHATLLHELIAGARQRQEQQWTETRDTTLILLMCQLALTVGELRALTLADVTHPQLPPSGQAHWLAQADLPDMTARSPVRLHITGTKRRPHLARSLEVPRPARDALTRWLELRLRQLPATASRARTAPLFVSRKGFAALSAKTVFLVANTHIGAVLGPAFSGPTGEIELKHAGPTTLRNSCLHAWLRAPGADAHDVALRAGLKDAASLARLMATNHGSADPAPIQAHPAGMAKIGRSDQSGPHLLQAPGRKRKLPGSVDPLSE